MLRSLPSRLRTVGVPKALLQPGCLLVQLLDAAVGGKLTCPRSRSTFPCSLHPVRFVILGLVASPASARPPQREVVPGSGSLVLADCGDGVLLTETFTEVHTFTTFFDASGNPVRVQTHENFDGVITNSASGNTYRDPGHWTIVEDLVNGTGTLHGEFYAIVAPGLGMIIQDTGRITFDADGNVIFQAGPHEVLTGTADFCSILV